MLGCLQGIVWIVVEIIAGRLIEAIIKRLTGRRVRYGWLVMLLGFFGIRLRNNRG